MKLSYHTHDLWKMGINLGLLLPDGRVADMRPDAFPGAEDLYHPDNPIKTSYIKEVRWLEAIKSFVYVLDEDVAKLDDPDHIFGKLCILIPENKLDCIKSIEDVL